MMMKDMNKNIDKLFKSRLGGDEIPYKPEYWDKMDQMLSKHPVPHFTSGATKILGLSKLAFISTVIVISTIITASIILTTHKTNKINTNNQTVINVVKNDSNKSESIYQEQVNQQKSSEANPITSVTKAETKPESSKTQSKTQSETVVKSETTPKKATTTKSSSERKSLPIHQIAAVKEEIPVKPKADQEIPGQEVVQTPIMNNSVKEDEVKPPVKEVIVNPEKIAILKIEEPKKEIVAETLKADTNIIQKPKAAEIAQKSNPKPPENLIDTIKPKKDTVMSKTAASGLLDKIAEKSRVSILLGGSIMSGFSNITNSPDQKLNFVAGLGYHYKYNDKMSFSLDGSYVRRSGSSLYRSSVRNYYFLFKETDSISLTTKSIDFLDFQLNVQRKFYSKHYLSGGLYFSTVINCMSDKTEMITSPFYTTTKTTEVKGYKEGIASFNYGINIDYKYQLFRNGYIGLRYNQSLNDLIDNKIYSATKKDYISDFQFYIKWMLY
jgi:hypothetical protein